ncbi:hypothetical protein H6M51_07000 [Rhizobium sp. AQ_MP]|uniref:YunG family protein n=1 Tax=Rhizobium sp. AQ_MP TaxID=2761536 RepID=UPI00163A41B9|nr:hypothetical protein [Rhizobium sp. AQ_MP]MBC2772603.1 hypothetical protein [Rhizobium sp. AQ_MP]
MVHLNVDLEQFAKRLASAWSRETSSLWSSDNPARGQCGVTSLVVHDVFGGRILKTLLPQRPHFYNLIEGRRLDFTSSQFDVPIDYLDLPSDRQEAMTDTNPFQYRALCSRLGLPVND